MFKSLIVTGVLSLSPVIGAAHACPFEQQGSRDDREAACVASLLQAAPSRNVATIFAAGPAGAATEISTKWGHEARDHQLALYYLRDYLGLERLAAARWQQFIAAPQPIYLSFTDPGTTSPLAWREEAEELLRRESAGYLNLQSAAAVAAAFAPLSQPFGAAAAYNALKRQDEEKWRQLGALSVKRGWELEYAPLKNTMIYMKDWFSQTSQRTLAEAKLGIAVFDPSLWGCPTLGKVYAGPFAVADGLRRDQIAKLGAHLTLSEIGAFHLTLAAGVAHEKLSDRGTFGLIETSWRF